MRILNAAQQAHYDSPPVFSNVERKRFFEFGMDAAHGLRSPASRIGFLLEYGYLESTAYLVHEIGGALAVALQKARIRTPSNPGSTWQHAAL